MSKSRKLRCRRPSQLTNRRVYQQLVYRKEVLKTLLIGSTTSSLPTPTHFSCSFSRSAFPVRYLVAWNRLIILWSWSRGEGGGWGEMEMFKILQTWRNYFILSYLFHFYDPFLVRFSLTVRVAVGSAVVKQDGHDFSSCDIYVIFIILLTFLSCKSV